MADNVAWELLKHRNSIAGQRVRMNTQRINELEQRCRDLDSKIELALAKIEFERFLRRADDRTKDEALIFALRSQRRRRSARRIAKDLFAFIARPLQTDSLTG